MVKGVSGRHPNTLEIRRMDMVARVSTYQPGPDSSGAPTEDTVNRVLQSPGRLGIYYLLGKDNKSLSITLWEDGAALAGSDDAAKKNSHRDQRRATHADPQRRVIRGADTALQRFSGRGLTARQARHSRSHQPDAPQDCVVAKDDLPKSVRHTSVPCPSPSVTT